MSQIIESKGCVIPKAEVRDNKEILEIIDRATLLRMEFVQDIP